MIREKDFTPYGLKSYSEKKLREEFTRHRDIVRKRLIRAIDAGLDDRGEYARRLASLPKLREIQTLQALRANLVEMHRFIGNRTTIQEIRQDRLKHLESLHRYGLNWLTMEELGDFMEYMEYMREKGYITNYGSPEVVKYYTVAKSRKMALDEIEGEFEAWMERNPLENISYK